MSEPIGGRAPNWERLYAAKLQRRRVANTALGAYIVALERKFHHLPDDFQRAAGNVPCPACGLEYQTHPRHPTVEWLTVLCSGKLVKL